MPTRFFKKEVPKTPVLMPNGDRILFESYDNVWGYYKTDKDTEINALVQLEREHKGGVFAITQDQYDDGIKKKGDLTQSRPNWREEIGSGIMQDTLAPRQAPAAAAAAVSPPIAPPPTTAALPAPPETQKKAARPPTVGKRSV